MQPRIRIQVATVVLLLALQVVLPAATAAASASPADTVDTLHAAINANDSESSIDMFAGDAVVIQPRIGGLPQIYVGREQIRWWLRNLASQHARWTVSEDPRLLDNHVRWSAIFSLDTFRDQGLQSVVVDNDLVLNNEQRIESLTTVFTPHSARMVQLAPVTTQTEEREVFVVATLLFSALVLCVGFVSGGATVRYLSRRRESIPSTSGIARPSRHCG
jgi:hypothetical protein